MRVPVALVGLLALVMSSVGTPVAAQCPRNIHDCSDEPFLPGDGSTTSTSNTIKTLYQYLTAGGYELTASVEMDSDGALRSGTTASVRMALSNATAMGRSNITISMHDAFGASFSGKQGAAFEFDPASGIEPAGSFQFRVDARAGGHVVIPIRLTVVDDAGTHEDFGVLNVPVRSEGVGPTFAGWFLPGLIGLALGAAVTALVLRRKR